VLEEAARLGVLCFEGHYLIVPEPVEESSAFPAG
jgi:hypothetical protein